MQPVEDKRKVIKKGVVVRVRCLGCKKRAEQQIKSNKGIL